MKLFLQFISDHHYTEIVQAELELRGYSYTLVELEMEELPLPPGIKYAVMKFALEKCELEMSQDHDSVLVSKMKDIIAGSMREHINGPPHIKYSVYLSEQLGHPYAYLSRLFSKAQCSTLERHIIALRTEMVKQLLVEEDLGLSEIAWRLGYCSVAHLSNQFKKITGTTPSAYKDLTRLGKLPNGIICEPCRQSLMGLLEGAGHNLEEHIT